MTQSSTYDQRRQLESLSRDRLAEYQLGRINQLLASILPQNAFYAQKLQGIRLPLESWHDFQQLPLTTKDELLSDDESGFAANRTYPVERYVRMHRTSGSRGRPLIVLDTAADWQWWVDVWQYVLDAARLSSGDRVVMAFSFGPFIGFWSAYDACVARGALVAPTGGMNSLARLELMRSLQATHVFCTPSYALRLAEVAAESHLDLRSFAVKCLVVAGEPGGSMPSVRERIENAWNAAVVDHGGASEVGPWGYADREGRGLHVNESEFVPEYLELPQDPTSEYRELVLTSLGRYGSPVIRYRTGDVVRPQFAKGAKNQFVLLEGGVVGRADDMLIVRGVNVYPTAIENILREVPEIGEFRMTALRYKQMDELRIEVEDSLNDPHRVSQLLHIRLGLRVDVACVPIGSLPRSEGKGRRFIDQRRQGSSE